MQTVNAGRSTACRDAGRDGFRFSRPDRHPPRKERYPARVSKVVGGIFRATIEVKGFRNSRQNNLAVPAVFEPAFSSVTRRRVRPLRYGTEKSGPGGTGALPFYGATRPLSWAKVSRGMTTSRRGCHSPRLPGNPLSGGVRPQRRCPAQSPTQTVRVRRKHGRQQLTDGWCFFDIPLLGRWGNVGGGMAVREGIEPSTV